MRLRRLVALLCICLILSGCQAPWNTGGHSELYLDGVSTEDVIYYFKEVCLSGEFAESSNIGHVHKWAQPIRYIITGYPTPEDLAVIEAFTQQLNSIDGFPGIIRTEPTETYQLEIDFCDRDRLEERIGGFTQEHTPDGAVTFRYNEDYHIISAIICCRTDLNQTLRNSVILEEIYNALGPIQDTSVRTDSIIYQGNTQPQALTEMDLLILQLLYHSDMKHGLSASECETVIESLYY